MTLTLQNVQPSLLELIPTANHFSAAERLFLAKTLLDGLVAEETEEFVDESPTLRMKPLPVNVKLTLLCTQLYSNST